MTKYQLTIKELCLHRKSLYEKKQIFSRITVTIKKPLQFSENVRGTWAGKRRVRPVFPTLIIGPTSIWRLSLTGPGYPAPQPHDGRRPLTWVN